MLLRSPGFAPPNSLLHMFYPAQSLCSTSGYIDIRLLRHIGNSVQGTGILYSKQENKISAPKLTSRLAGWLANRSFLMSVECVCGHQLGCMWINNGSWISAVIKFKGDRMLLYHLFPLTVLIITTYAWEFSAKLVNGKTYPVWLFTGATRGCGGFPFGPRAFDFFVCRRRCYRTISV